MHLYTYKELACYASIIIVGVIIVLATLCIMRHYTMGCNSVHACLAAPSQATDPFPRQKSHDTMRHAPVIFVPHR